MLLKFKISTWNALHAHRPVHFNRNTLSVNKVFHLVFDMNHYYYSAGFGCQSCGFSACIFVEPFSIGIKSDGPTKTEHFFKLTNNEASVLLRCFSEFNVKALALNEDVDIKEKIIISKKDYKISLSMTNLKNDGEKSFKVTLEKESANQSEKRKLFDCCSEKAFSEYVKVMLEMYMTAITNNITHKIFLKRIIAFVFKHATTSDEALSNIEDFCKLENVAFRVTQFDNMTDFLNMIFYNKKFIKEWAYLLEFNCEVACEQSDKTLKTVNDSTIWMELLKMFKQ